MAKKGKSIYDKPLKDINKDGKVNFGDTWLGDALGFDGKMGIQKGRPGLRDSLKGARRGETKSEGGTRPRVRPSSSGSKAEPSSRLDTKGETPKAPRRTTDSGMDAKAAATRAATRGRSTPPKTSSKAPKAPTAPSDSKAPKVPGTSTPPKTSVAPKAPTPPTAGIEGIVARSNERQRNARAEVIQSNKAERASTPSEQQIQAWLRTQPAQFHKANPSAEAKRAAAMKALSSKSGMAKGGMAKKKEGRYKKSGNTDYKSKGMFYKTGSPKGYK